MNFTFPEIFVVSSIVCLMAFECVSSIRSRSWVEVYRPTLFITIILAFYVLLGPLRAIFSTGEAPNFVGTSGTVYRMFEHRQLLIYGWAAALVFYASVLFGFHFVRIGFKRPRIFPDLDLNKARRLGQVLCLIALSVHAIIKIQLFLTSVEINPDHVLYSFLLPIFRYNDFTFAGYLVFLSDLFVPGVLLQISVWLRRREKTPSLLFWIIISTALFVNQGFRYKLFMLYAPALLLWLFYVKKRPKLVLGTLLIISSIAVSGAVSVWRSEARGSSIDNSSLSPIEVIISGFEEAGTFFTSSLVISLVPSTYNYIGLEPIVTTLLQPFPRSLLPNKPPGDYTYRIQDRIYSTQGELTWKSHTAFLGFVEYYLIAGWTSLVAISIAIGSMLKSLWSWFLLRQHEPIAQTIYLLNACYLYSIISRGYLPQVIMGYCGIVLPVYLVYRWLASRSRLSC